eukprot:462474-Rhodomonas_salina.1
METAGTHHDTNANSEDDVDDRSHDNSGCDDVPSNDTHEDTQTGLNLPPYHDDGPDIVHNDLDPESADSSSYNDDASIESDNNDDDASVNSDNDGDDDGNNTYTAALASDASTILDQAIYYPELENLDETSSMSSSAASTGTINTLLINVLPTTPALNDLREPQPYLTEPLFEHSIEQTLRLEMEMNQVLRQPALPRHDGCTRFYAWLSHYEHWTILLLPPQAIDGILQLRFCVDVLSEAPILAEGVRDGSNLFIYVSIKNYGQISDHRGLVLYMQAATFET